MSKHMAPKGRTRGSRRRARLLLSLVLLLGGAELFFYPAVSAWMAQQSADRAIERALSNETRDVHRSDAQHEFAFKAGNAAYEYLDAYNQEVAAGEGEPINDPWGMGSNKGELLDIGLQDGMIGSVSIPVLGETLPLYMGATDENMEKGAAVVAGTSAPLGGSDTNCVIAAHRGVWNGLRMFRDIENIQKGDRLTIRTPWGLLAYQAVEVAVIDSNDVDAVRVRAERDLVTLITCHPYGQNTKRYMVVFERVAHEGGVAGEVQSSDVAGFFLELVRPVLDLTHRTDSPLLLFERILRVIGLLILALAIGMLTASLKRCAGSGRCH